MSIFDRIRSHSREEWQQHFAKKVKEIRIWIQEHPEKAALVSLIIGMAFVLFFRLFFWIVLLFFLGIFGIWGIALPESQRSKSD